MTIESEEIKNLFGKLCAQVRRPFPQSRQPLDAPSKPGVYIIYKRDVVLHVGRTVRGKGGLHQRLRNHLQGASSFTQAYFHGKGSTLKENGYTYKYFELDDPRTRALLEAYAIGILCPKHLGLGVEITNE